MDLADAAGWGALVVLLGALFAIDLKVFARGREPAFREGVRWSVGWLLVALAAAVPVWALSGPGDAGSYVTVYLIERALSLDNLFVFLLLFAYFGIPVRERSRLLFWGIAAALVLRAAAILSGIALLERFAFLIYVLGLALLLLAYRMFRGVAENVDPDRNLIARPAADLDGQSIRAVGHTRAVRARGRAGRPLPLHAADSGSGPGGRRRQVARGGRDSCSATRWLTRGYGVARR